MMIEKLRHLEELLLKRHFSTRDNLQGCSAGDIQELENRFALTLPAFYKEFLLRMGRGAGSFLRGSDVFYPELLELRNYAEELLREVGATFQLRKTDFVFFVHQGYQFAYFEADSGDDPQVSYFYETWKSPERRGCLSEYLFSIARADYDHPSA